MRRVLDASVIVKWLLRDPEREGQSAEARSLMQAVAAGEVEVLQPPHWLAEVAAVMARLSPGTLATDITDLYALDFEVAGSLAIYQRATDLAVKLNQHVFDTLYHAVALESADCTLVTADLRYLRTAREQGRIVGLEHWRQSA
ncbi:MAG: type II toxin-antitoxin system VapC family toxin [Candidatus Methylophosphatis roskildensis]